MTGKSSAVVAYTALACALGFPLPGRADDVQCTIKIEACGALEQTLSPLTKIKEGICLKADLATIGKKPKGAYYSAVVWIGVSVSGVSVRPTPCLT
jgi:hypothetical protein